MSIPIDNIVVIDTVGGRSSSIVSNNLTLMVLAKTTELKADLQEGLLGKTKEYNSIANVQTDAHADDGLELIAIATAFFANRGIKLKIYFTDQDNPATAYSNLRELSVFHNALICSNSFTITNSNINTITNADDPVIFGFTATESNYDEIQVTLSSRPMTHLSYATSESITVTKSNAYIFAALAGLYSTINRNGINTDRSAEYLTIAALTPSTIPVSIETKLTEKGTARITTLASFSSNVILKGTKMANATDFLQVNVAKNDFISQLQSTGFNLLASVNGIPYDVNGYSKLINAAKNDCIKYHKNGCFVPMVSQTIENSFPEISDNKKLSLMTNGFAILSDASSFNPTTDEKQQSKMPTIQIAVNFGRTASIIRFTLDVRGD